MATHAINPLAVRQPPYDPVKDFAPVTIVASVPNVLVMNVEFAQKNKIEKLVGLIDYAKKNPGKLNYGSGGNGSDQPWLFANLPYDPVRISRRSPSWPR